MHLQVAFLAISGTIIASAAYFLWRIILFPHIGNIDATLIGVTMTTAAFLCGLAITSRKGNPVESSLVSYSTLSAATARATFGFRASC
ncbi:hypothetical protein IMZ48_27250 [Candidatus Bathyarchaeota archaeon]|nr:hypothetical protein [Candidatus Bathyarchaeota archaeon]